MYLLTFRAIKGTSMPTLASALRSDDNAARLKRSRLTNLGIRLHPTNVLPSIAFAQVSDCLRTSYGSALKAHDMGHLQISGPKIRSTTL